MNNLGEGTFTYNISQVIAGVQKLTAGNYFGEMFCGVRSRDNFDFEVGTVSPGISISSGGRWYSGVILGVEDGVIVAEEIDNRIPKDIKYYLKYASEKVMPSNPIRGKYIILCLFFLFLFFPEIRKTIKKVRVKKKW